MVTALEQYKIIILCFSKVVPAGFLCLLNYNQADTKSLRAQLRKNKTFFFLSGFFFTSIHDSRGSRGRGRVSIQLLSTASTHFAGAQLGIGRAMAAGGLGCAQLATGLEPGTFGFRAQVANHQATRRQPPSYTTSI